jgi:hypothetical protein
MLRAAYGKRHFPGEVCLPTKKYISYGPKLTHKKLRTIAEFILHPAINYSDPIVRGNLKFVCGERPRYKFAKQQAVCVCVNFGL